MPETWEAPGGKLHHGSSAFRHAQRLFCAGVYTPNHIAIFVGPLGPKAFPVVPWGSSREGSLTGGIESPRPSQLPELTSAMELYFGMQVKVLELELGIQ
jgi:hypothetical protein